MGELFIRETKKHFRHQRDEMFVRHDMPDLLTQLCPEAIDEVFTVIVTADAPVAPGDQMLAVSTASAVTVSVGTRVVGRVADESLGDLQPKLSIGCGALLLRVDLRVGDRCTCVVVR